MNKEEIEKAKDDLRFFNEGDYITKEMEHSAIVLEEYIKELENKAIILDKVKEFIKKDVTTENIKIEGNKLFKIINKDLIDYIKEKIVEGINSYKKEIENIIGGEK